MVKRFVADPSTPSPPWGRQASAVASGCRGGGRCWRMGREGETGGAERMGWGWRIRRVAVHGGSGVSFGVIEQLRQARPAARMLELVHRLDRETSGVLLVAKKRSALTRLQDQFRDRETGKTYLALVHGQWPSNKKVIDLPLQRYLLPDGVGEGERRVRIAALTDPGAQRAITLVRVARLVGDFSLLEVTIKTGRTHQIRVHLASQGYPIVGDDKYGDFSLNKRLAAQGLKRMFLHAWRLQFIHPSLGKPQTLQADLPPELQQFVDHVQPPPPTPI